MADAVVAEQPDLGLTASPGQKRRRGPGETSPGDRRSKRSAPAATMSAGNDATAAFIDDAQAAAVNVSDFTALQQAAAAEHSEAADPANAAGTAAAALGSMYPTLHVPPSTEETFAAQVAEGDHTQDTSFTTGVTHADSLLDASVSVGPVPTPGSNGVRVAEPRYSSSGGVKPPVGSDEWHKMRKDNHKEGK
jgi:transcriptional regulator CBF1